nr:reverse transcriptase [Ipomoea batatas]
MSVDSGTPSWIDHPKTLDFVEELPRPVLCKRLQIVRNLIKQVKTGNILDKEGYIKYSDNPEETQRILKKFEKVGLMKYLTHDYQNIHALDFTEWFANAKVKDSTISLKGLHLRDGKEVNRNTYMGRTRPLAPKSKVVKPAPPPHELKGKGKDKAKLANVARVAVGDAARNTEEIKETHSDLNYDIRRAAEMGIDVSAHAKKKSKTSIAKRGNAPAAKEVSTRAEPMAENSQYVPTSVPSNPQMADPPVTDAKPEVIVGGATNLITTRSLINIWKLKIPSRIHTFLWLARHDFLMTNENRMKRGFTNYSRCEAAEINKAMDRATTMGYQGGSSLWKLIRWIKPPPGWIKINISSSFNPNTRFVKCGELARDEQGNWLKGFRSMGPPTRDQNYAADFLAKSHGAKKGATLLDQPLEGMLRILEDDRCGIPVWNQTNC